MMAKGKSRVWGLTYQLAIHVGFVLLAILVLLLAQQNREMKDLLLPPEQVKTGDYFGCDDLEPENTSLHFDSSQKSVIFVFTTECSFCRENRLAWDLVSTMIISDSISVIGISLDSRQKTEEYIQDSVSYPVYIVADPNSFRERNRIRGVPQTIVRTETGIVEMIWTGPLSDEDISEVIGHTFSDHNPAD